VAGCDWREICQLSRAEGEGADGTVGQVLMSGLCIREGAGEGELRIEVGRGDGADARPWRPPTSRSARRMSAAAQRSDGEPPALPRAHRDRR